jgi:hypothetical protein
MSAAPILMDADAIVAFLEAKRALADEVDAKAVRLLGIDDIDPPLRVGLTRHEVASLIASVRALSAQSTPAIGRAAA